LHNLKNLLSFSQRLRKLEFVFGEELMIRVLLADDHAIVRSGLKQLLLLADDIQVTGEATDGAEVMDRLRTGRFDLILLDMSMPGISGIDLIARIRLQGNTTPILVLSMRNEIEMVRRTLGVGANGYLTKSNEPEVLLAAIRKTAAGKRFIDPLLVDDMVFSLVEPDLRPPHEQLSDREFHIFRLLALGKTVNDIAGELAISNKTVSTHKARLMQKMNLASNADLVRYGVEHGLIE
jgi:DNA-binding NarL/FixJ family response regulator